MDPEPQLRRDPLTGRWSVIAGARHGRPVSSGGDAPGGCPFCVGGLEAPDPYVARAFPNRWPSLVPGAAVDVASLDGTVHPSLRASGASEVVLYSPDHHASLATIGDDAVRRVVDLWAERTAELGARDEVAYVLVFENRGAEVGATIAHPHGQVFGLPVEPPEHLAEVAQSEALGGCCVCAAREHELADQARLVAACDGASAWVPFASGWPYGLLVACDDHVADLPALGDAGRDALARVLGCALGAVDEVFGEQAPYMMWIHQGLHVHVHVVPVWRSPRLMRFLAAGELGSGMQVNPVAPEDAAVRLRATDRVRALVAT